MGTCDHFSSGRSIKECDDGESTGWSATMASAMTETTRRDFLMLASTVTLGAFSMPRSSRAALEPPPRQRVFVASHAADGILKFDWDPLATELIRVGVATKVPNVAWIAKSGSF